MSISGDFLVDVLLGFWAHWQHCLVYLALCAPGLCAPRSLGMVIGFVMNVHLGGDVNHRLRGLSIVSQDCSL